PQVDGLPLGAETMSMSDVPPHQAPVLAVAFDLTKHQVKIALENLKPNLIFFDFTYWLPPLAESLGALPEGFEERVKGRGVVHGDWIQQEQILSHPSVGCFVSHCGIGSMWESLVSSCQIVLVPQFGDQYPNAKFMTKELKVAVDVERREEDGWFTKESVCNAVKLVMDERK
ncbi:Udp-glycosyltransferase 79b3, partial [Thalictrum thalictroides]